MKTKQTLKDVFTGKYGYVDEEVLAAAPETEGEIKFFSMGRYATAQEVADEYDKRNLVPAGAAHLGAWVEAHKDDERKYFVSQWKDKDGKFCYLTFDRWGGEPRVYCYRGGSDWDGVRWWLAGVPAPASASVSEAKDSSETSDLELRVKRLEDIVKHHNLAEGKE